MVDETNDPNKLQTELDPCSPFHGRNKKTTATTIIPSSQPKPVSLDLSASQISNKGNS
jgi:hypothetical protein